jgi:hypothetical protein
MKEKMQNNYSRILCLWLTKFFLIPRVLGSASPGIFCGQYDFVIASPKLRHRTSKPMIYGLYQLYHIFSHIFFALDPISWL